MANPERDRRRDGGRGWLILVFASFAALTAPRLAPGDEDDGTFRLTTPVACKSIDGYEDYVPLDPPALTADEKLLVYVRPVHFKTAKAGGTYEAHFTEDARIRRRGAKAVLWSKSRLLDYRPHAPRPPRLIYLRNTIALKGLKPGDYDLDLIVRDEVGKSAPATATLPFTVIPARESPAADAP